jgi:hypothetical protein
MKTRGVHGSLVSSRAPAVAIVVLAAIATVALLVVPASAKRFSLVGRDGKIHGCYRVKGKPKGMLRVVRARRYHCLRGERKVSWSVATTAGQNGAAGQDGQPGTTATATTNTGKEALLQSEIDGLLTRLNGLEAVLAGLDNKSLKEAVASVPLVEQLCAQTPALAKQANAMQEVVENLGLNSVLTTLGGLIEVTGLPAKLKLEDFGCAP